MLNFSSILIEWNIEQVLVDYKLQPVFFLNHKLEDSYGFGFVVDGFIRVVKLNGEFQYPPTYVQPLKDNWLIVCRRGNDEQENAFVYNDEGHLLKKIQLGDAINDVQTTKEGEIWVGYSDEGVYGSDSYGMNGLVCFNENGEPLLQYHDIYKENDLEAIDDCYAFNVTTNEDVYVYYYSSFPIVKIKDKKIAHVWSEIPLTGSSGFAIDKDVALFAGTYQHKNSLFLINLSTYEYKEVTPITIDQTELKYKQIYGRGNKLFLVTDMDVYAITI
jgi:hypothetical protein